MSIKNLRLIIFLAALLILLSLIFPTTFFGLGPFHALPLILKVFILIITGLFVFIAFKYKTSKIESVRFYPVLIALTFSIAALFLSQGVSVWAGSIDKTPSLAIKKICAAVNYPGELIWTFIIRNTALIATNFGKTLFQLSPLLSAIIVFIAIILCYRISRRKVFSENENLVFMVLIFSGLIPTLIGALSISWLALLSILFFMLSSLIFLESRRNSPGLPVISFILATLLYPPAIVTFPALLFFAVKSSKRIDSIWRVLYISISSIIALLPLVILVSPEPKSFSEFWNLDGLISLSGWANTIFSSMLTHPLIPITLFTAIIGLLRWRKTDDIEKFCVLSTLGFFVGATALKLPYKRFDWPLVVGLSPLAFIPLLIWITKKSSRKLLATTTAIGFLVFVSMLIGLTNSKSTSRWIEKWASPFLYTDEDITFLYARANEYTGKTEIAGNIYNSGALKTHSSKLIYNSARMSMDSNPEIAYDILHNLARIDTTDSRPLLALSYLELEKDSLKQSFMWNRQGVIRIAGKDSPFKAPFLIPPYALERDLVAFRYSRTFPDNKFSLFALYNFFLYGGEIGEFDTLLDYREMIPFLTKIYKIRENKEDRTDEIMSVLQTRDLGRKSTGNEIADELVLAAAQKTVMGQMNEAVDLAEKVIEMVSDYPRIYYIIGYGMQIQGDADSAMVLYQKTVKLDDQFANAWSNMGVIEASKGNLKKAEEYFKKAVEILPDKADYHLNLGRIYHMMHDLRGNIREFEKYMELNPNSPDSAAITAEIDRLRKQIESPEK